MTALMQTSATGLKRVGVFVWKYGVPVVFLLVLALADGMVRTVALLAFLLVIAAKGLLLVSDAVKQAAPAGPVDAARPARAPRGGAR